MQNSKKYTVGVILYSSPGTKTSILLWEFLIFNKLAELNPNVKFVFIPVTKTIEKRTLKHVHLLKDHVDWDILRIDYISKLPKLDDLGFSGFFTYLLRNNFFGGGIDPRCNTSYCISSYVTNHLKLPLFIRTPDSEYNYQDYYDMIQNRMVGNSKDSFISRNEDQIDRIQQLGRIDYNYVHWIANGSKEIYDWVPDVVYNNVSDYLKSEDIKESIVRSHYLSDDIFFEYNQQREELNLNINKNHDDKICYAGFLKGSVAEKRPKRLKEIFGKNEYEIPTRVFGPGSIDIKSLQNKNNIELIDDFIPRYYDFLNKQMAVIHCGKGQEKQSYISKSIYDCVVAAVPSLIYLPCDQNRIIFGDDRFYFSNEKELFDLYNKLKSERVREEYINDQRDWIENVLSNKMNMNFKFSDHCREGIYKTTKLF